jgi:lipopolysaccharide export system permease protein
MRTIIHRYLASSFILPFVVSTLFFVTFLLTFQLFRITDLIVSKGVSLAYTLELFGHIAITFLPMAIPLSVLFATLYTFNKLCNDSEYVALRSFGLKKNYIFTPFFLVAILISVVTYSLTQNLIPYSKTQFKKALSNMRSTSLLADIKSGQFFTSIPGITLFAEKVTDNGLKLENVFINFKADKNITKSIFALKGELVQIIDKSTNVENIRLALEDGNIISNDQKGRIDKILFKKYNFPVGDKSMNAMYAQKANMMSGATLRSFINQYKDTIKKTDSNYDNFMRLKLEYWTRFNTPMQCLVFCLIGFVLGVRDVRSGKGGKAGLNLLVLLAYYILFFFLVSQARSGRIPTQVAIFLPTILLTIFGISQYKKIDWVS